MSVHLSVRVPESVDTALERVAQKVNTSKSEIVRRYLSDAVEGDDAVPDDLRRQVQRERAKEENKIKHYRIHFRSNVADKFKTAFEQGDLAGPMGDYAIEDIRETYEEEAEIIFEDDDREEQAIEYVRAVADHAKESSDASEFDRLDPEEMFEHYAGVETGRQRQDVDLDVVVEEARRRIDAGAGDEAALRDALANEFGIPEDLAREAVSRAISGDPGGGDGE